MSHVPPEERDAPRFQSGHEAEGKVPALIAWALYILSIPSANLLVLVGLVVAYAGRGSATGVAREHIEAQIRLFWSVFWWTIGMWILAIISFITVILIPLGFVLLLLLFLLSVWFTVKSVLGLVNLLGDKAP
jgi:uncharacterized membrane protein